MVRLYRRYLLKKSEKRSAALDACSPKGAHRRRRRHARHLHHRVLDGFLEARFNLFDRYVGVSSGAGNLAAYLAEMPERNFKIYTDYSLRPEFISLKRFFRGGHLMDLDWLWDGVKHRQ